LLSEVNVPTLVLHSRHDQMIDLNEGRIIASSIPGARLVPLESRNHIVLADEPAWATFMAEVADFLSADAAPTGSEPPTPTPPLSEREREILRLAARGLDNVAIAKQLVLSVRTVERHLSNIYLKLGVSGKSARAAAVAHLFMDQATP
jgi:DNA-binding NarL/FixJ family response regulator